MNYFKYRLIGYVSLLTITLWAFSPNTIYSATSFPEQTATNALQHAWELARLSGRFNYQSRIKQTTYPAPAVSNAGRSPRTANIGISGSVALANRTLDMTIWQDGSFDPSHGLEVQVKADQAQARLNSGEWQEIDNVADLFAPAGDPLAFLAAATNIQQGETRTYNFASNLQSLIPNPQYTKYTFTLDGPAFAEFVRTQNEQLLREQNRLPYTLSLTAPNHYRNMSGSGQLWLDDSTGLPARLTIQLEMPLESGERVTADLTNDYSAFDLEQIKQASATIYNNPTIWFQQQAELFIQSQTWSALGLMVSGLLLFVLTIRYWHTPQLYKTIVSAVIFGMVVTPLINAEKVAAFYQDQYDQALAQNNRHAENEQIAQAQAAANPTWNPHLSLVQAPLVGAPSAASTRNAATTNTLNSASIPLAPDAGDTADSDNDQLTDTDEAFWDTCPYPLATAPYNNEPNCEGVTNPADSDGDSFSDYVEVYQIGTLPNADDTDGDTILDQFEINGFTYNGQQWHLNPTNPDTNGDGRIDSLECPQWSTSMADYNPHTVCPDTDNDGRPDLFDIDDDDDGMDDIDDTSPNTVPSQTFDKDTPLELQVNNLETDKPLLLTLQFRPTAEETLHYNGHVLDWPTGDTAGQIQRHLDTTFYTTQNSAIQAADGRADFGDVRVVPMLELTIPYTSGHYGNLPVKDHAPATRNPNTPVEEWLDTAELARYGVRINDAGDGSGDLLAYLPLNTVTSNTGEEAIAFQANMLYWPSQGTTADSTIVEWGNAQQLRAVWLVQMLTDTCVDPTADPDTCQRQDTLQVIQTYYDEWELTSLTLSEEHGLDVALLYENPAADLDLNVDDELWLASWNLGNTFLRGRDCDSLVNDQCSSDGQRDVTVQNIAAKLDQWSGNTSYIDVATFSYPHRDLLPTIMLTETNTILNTVFNGYETQTYPTFLFMQEHRARTAGLGDSSNFVDHQLTIDFANSDLINMGLLSWDSYSYNTATQTWNNFNPQDYLSYLDWQLQQQTFFQPTDDSLDAQATAEGKRIWAQAYYLSLRQGITAWQETNNQLMWQDNPAVNESAFAEYEYLLNGVSEIGTVAGFYLGALSSGVIAKIKGVFTSHKTTYWAAVQKAYSDKIGRHTVDFQQAYYTIIGSHKQESISHTISPHSAKVFGFITVAVALVAAGLITNAATNDKEAVQTADALTKSGTALLVATDTFFTISESAKIVTEARKIVFFSSSIAKASKLIKAARTSAAIGFVIVITLEVALFFGLWIAGQIDPGNLAFWLALATLIATVIIESILLIIALVLPVIGSIIVLLIQLADFIASLFNASFIEALGEKLAEAIYDVDIILSNLSDPGRLTIDILDTTLEYPDLGYIYSNRLNFTVGVTNTLRYRDSASDGDGRRSTFRYFLETNNVDKHSSLRLNQMNSEWEELPGPYLRVSDELTQSVDLFRVNTGINRNLDGQLYLIEAYAAPVEGCFTFFDTEYGCKYFTTPASNPINIGETLIYDILPDTFAEFVSLQWHSSSADSTLPFPPQADLDADGLGNPAAGGADIDDTTTDSDGDGLTDYYEITYGLNASAADADLDGLNDKEELILGTNPFEGDSDSDGLNDYVETIQGWLVPYDSDNGLAYTRVWSNPWIADEDQDSLSDLEEFVFGQHPQIETDPSVLENLIQINNLDLDEENNLLLLGRFEEFSDVELFTDGSGRENDLFCDRATAACPTTGADGRYGSAITFDGNDALTTNLNLDLTFADFTAAMWVKTTATNVTIFSKGTPNGSWENGERALYIDSNGYPRFEGQGNGFVNGTQTVNDGRWHHLTLTYDYINGSNTNVDLYLDGAPLYGASYGASVADANAALWFGRAVNNSMLSDFTGVMDEVTLLSAALTASEVVDLYNGRLNPNDLYVTPATTLTYRATVTNTSPLQGVNGFITADTSYLTPTVAYPAVALDYEPSDQINTFTNWIGESSTATCLGDGSCPKTGMGGRYDAAVHFTQSQDAIILPSMGGAFTSYAVAFWLNVEVLPQSGKTMSIIDTARTDAGALDIYINSAGNLVFDVAGQTPIITNYSLTADLYTWQHFVFSFRDYNPSHAYIFRNASQIQTASFGVNDLPLIVGPGTIGNNATRTAPLFGTLDELVFYNNDDIGKSDSFGDDIEVISVYNGIYNTHQDGWYDFTQPSFLLKFDDVASNYDHRHFPDSTSHYTAECTEPFSACPVRTKDGYNDYGLAFDGVNDTILTSANYTAENLRVSFYINPASYPTAGNRATILDTTAAGIDIHMDETGRIGVSREGQLVWTFADDTIPLNSWTKVNVVFSRGYQSTWYYRLNISFDGQSVRTNSYCANSGGCSGYTTTVGNGAIGRSLENDIDFFHGRLDEFIIQDTTYTFELNSAEISYINRATDTQQADCAFVDTCPAIDGSGVFGAAVAFDGVDDHLTLGQVDFAQGDYTIATWVKSSNDGFVQTVLSAVAAETTSNDIILETTPGGYVRLFHRFPTTSSGANVYSPFGIADGQWHHVAAVRQGTQLLLYIDGVLANQVTTTTANATAPLEVTLGRSAFANQYFNGSLDHTLIIPAAVNAEGIQLLMNTRWPIIDIPAEFVTFNAPATQSVEISGTATVDQDALSSIHQFDEEVEAALELSQAIEFPTLDLPATTLNTFVPFEDVPGSTLVENATSTTEYNCTGDRCPTLGLRGFIDRAAFFDGFNDQLMGGVAGSTYAVWVKADQGTIFAGITGNGPGLALDTNRLFVAMTSEDSAVFYAPYELPLEIPKNEWTHVAVVMDTNVTPAVAHVYLNGQLNDSLEITRYNLNTKPIGADYDLGIGSKSLGANVDGSDPLRGYLDDFRVYAEILSAAQIQTLYNQSAPLMRFEFDEGENATAFLDISQNGYVGVPRTVTAFNSDLGQTVTTLNPTPGTDGKIGHTALFNGDGYIAINDAAAIGSLTNNFTLMGWIKPDNVNDLQRILSSGRSLSNNGLGFGLYAGGFIFTSYGIKDYIQAAPLEAGVWQHVAVAVDSNNDAHFFVDGVLIGTVTHNAPAMPNLDDPLYIGVNAETDGTFNQFFNGQIDELATYGRALAEAEISSIYLRELRWYRDRATFAVTVDTDNPAVSLVTTTPYRDNSYQQLVVTTTDPTSRVTLLDFGLKGPNDSDFSWQSAPACQEALHSGTAWCPYFNPAAMQGEGVYTVKFRAVDVVGNETVSDEYQFLVDGTAPHATSSYNNTAVNLTETADLNWAIDLNGTLSDPLLNGTSQTGSGIDPTSVVVTLLDETGRIVGKIGQPAEVSGSNWSLTYHIKGFRPLGTATIQLTVADQVGNMATHQVGTFIFDERPPQASFNHWLVDTAVISDTLSLVGSASDQAQWGGEQIALHFDAPIIENGTTIWHDSSPYAQHASCTTCPTVDANSVFGQAAEFNSNNQALSFPHLFNPAETPFTAALWFKAAAPSGDFGPLIQQDASTTNEQGQIWLAYEDNKLVTFLGGSVLSSAAVVTEGQWHHAAVSYDGTTVRLYLNGQLVAAAARPVPSNSDGLMKLGISQLLSNRFNGSIDELFIYNHVLTGEEIFALAYTAGVGLQNVEVALRPLDFAAIAAEVVPEETLNWQPATVSNGSWQYTVSADLEGYYEIALRAADNYGNNGREATIWRGLIDNVPPAVTASGQYIGGSTAPATEYTFTFTDLALNLNSFVQPCSTEELVHLTYKDPTLAYNGLSYEVSATCRVSGHEASREFSACDTVGHCTTITVNPTTAAVGNIVINTPLNGALFAPSENITISGGAYDPSVITSITLYATGSKIATPAFTGNDSSWSVDWSTNVTGTYLIEAVLVGASGTVTDAVEISVIDEPLLNLSVTVTGSGQGIVTSKPAGISCPANCTTAFAQNTMVTLTASPTAGSTFSGWNGACSGSGTCTVTMTEAKSVSATFVPDNPKIYLPLLINRR